MDFVAVNVYFGWKVAAPGKADAAGTGPAERKFLTAGWRGDSNATVCVEVMNQPGQNKEVALGNVFAMVGPVRGPQY